mmetsp:Transcript_11033/g.12620  ORF Transcript_11033/g.12620 Transcript_11033/m.12620 type:complete len:420 (+) Transcript_11033:75-1334(+)|eukprot:CAMPEP_0194392658 /NCGR_PEP_ID=MMETSP0174-20130528/122856_1 /TAXON_ID=216777 /ORGANISM="Proboscia alata, Strain PI-D3" /LENGTH=419 /DNA_ID=CAMNT_0039188247 /DNA_START=81 /DNA_END=1340 /DNA_ORIENTATION=+
MPSSAESFVNYALNQSSLTGDSRLAFVNSMMPNCVSNNTTRRSLLLRAMQLNERQRLIEHSALAREAALLNSAGYCDPFSSTSSQSYSVPTYNRYDEVSQYPNMSDYGILHGRSGLSDLDRRRELYYDSITENPLVHSLSSTSAGALGTLDLVEERMKASCAANQAPTRPKKRKNMPKRPLSAYNIFFREERARILEEIPCTPRKKKCKKERTTDSSPETVVSTACKVKSNDDVEEANSNKQGLKKRPHGKIGFENLARTIAKRWKSLEAESISYYKKIANKDTMRYKEEMNKYRIHEAKQIRLSREKAYFAGSTGAFASRGAVGNNNQSEYEQRIALASTPRHMTQMDETIAFCEQNRLTNFRPLDDLSSLNRSSAEHALRFCNDERNASGVVMPCNPTDQLLIDSRSYLKRFQFSST